MSPSEFFQWYYMIYLLPGGLAMLLLLLSAMGGGAHHHHHGGLHAGHHGGLHTGHHGGLHTGHHGGLRRAGPNVGGVKHAGPNHGGRRQPNSGAGTSQTMGAQILAFFGIGRVPGPFVFGSMLLGWGLFGFWTTRILQQSLHAPALFLLPAFGAAFAGALATMRATAFVGGKLLPQEASTAISTVELCGQTGTAAFPVNETRGRVHIYDAHGTLHDVTARTTSGHPDIRRGRTVLVVDYDSLHNQVIVEEIE